MTKGILGYMTVEYGKIELGNRMMVLNASHLTAIDEESTVLILNTAKHNNIFNQCIII